MRSSKIFLFLLILTSYSIQPVFGLDAIYTDVSPNIDGVFSITEWSKAIEKNVTLHFEWRVNAQIGGEFYVNSSWFSLWDDSTIYFAFIYERRPDVELVDEIIVLYFDKNHNQKIDNGEFSFAARLQEEGARSKDSPGIYSIRFYQIRDSEWELLEDSNLGHASLKKSETHIVFEIAINTDDYELDDNQFSFMCQISSFQYGNTGEVFYTVNIMRESKDTIESADNIQPGIQGFPILSITIGLIITIIVLRTRVFLT